MQKERRLCLSEPGDQELHGVVRDLDGLISKMDKKWSKGYWRFMPGHIKDYISKNSDSVSHLKEFIDPRTPPSESTQANLKSPH